MSDLWIGFCLGYVVAVIISVIIEAICIKTGRSSIDTWMEEDDER